MEAEKKKTTIGFLLMEWRFSVCFLLAFLKSKVFNFAMSALVWPNLYLEMHRYWNPLDVMITPPNAYLFQAT